MSDGMTLAHLGSLRRWVAWRGETRHGRLTKVPYSPAWGQQAKSDDPSTWHSRSTAQTRARRIANGHGGGVGLMLGPLDDKHGIGGIDLDTCRCPDGKIEPWAAEVMARFPTYTEVSPSGTGIKLLFTYPAAALPELRAAMGAQHGRMFKSEGGEHPPSIELHLGNRYFAITDDRLADAPADLRYVSVETLLWLIGEAGPAFIGTRALAAAGRPGSDQSRSAAAFRLASTMKRNGHARAEIIAALASNPATADWTAEKGLAESGRELARVLVRAGERLPDPELLAHPEMGVLRLHRRVPPALPLDVFGPAWRQWIEGAADAAACPPDYVAAPLLAAASALIGNARWAQATPGWAEPPHLWCASVGESGDGKSPGADALMRDVLPMIERSMVADFPDKLREWRAAAEVHAANVEKWKADVRAAQKAGNAPPLPPEGDTPAEPQAPRLRQSDVTIEKLAELLADAAPKGLLIVRDELAGWSLGMNAYNDAGRAFWIEAYGGRPYRVERKKHPQPIEVPRLAVAVAGTTQPDKLGELMREADDGLLARFCWCWPEPVPFALGRRAPGVEWATAALDRLRLLDLVPGAEVGAPPRPLYTPLTEDALPELVVFAREMQERQQTAGGLMRSALGKARGTALRLSLVIELLWWCGEDRMATPPVTIGKRAFLAAANLVADYLMPMAERVYGDAATPPADRNAATLARWIFKMRPANVNTRRLHREVRLPGLNDAETIHAACRELVAAGWLIPPPSGGTAGRPKASYAVNRKIYEVVE